MPQLERSSHTTTKDPVRHNKDPVQPKINKINNFLKKKKVRKLIFKKSFGLRVWSLCSATGEAATVRGPLTAMRSGPHSPQLEKALAQKRRPNTAIN